MHGTHIMTEHIHSGAHENEVPLTGSALAERVWEESWTYIKTVVDTVREPFLVLDKDLCVMAANESFYRTFQVEVATTEKRHVYELGNGQWNIPALRKLLEEILPSNTFFKGFEVIHMFPGVGRKVMILNARRIFQGGTAFGAPPIILLAMEDVTEIMSIAEGIAEQARANETKILHKLKQLERQTEGLARDMAALKLQRL
jgi:hypothetical protein